MTPFRRPRVSREIKRNEEIPEIEREADRNEIWDTSGELISKVAAVVVGVLIRQRISETGSSSFFPPTNKKVLSNEMRTKLTAKKGLKLDLKDYWIEMEISVQ